MNVIVLMLLQLIFIGKAAINISRRLIQFCTEFIDPSINSMSIQHKKIPAPRAGQGIKRAVIYQAENLIL